MPDSYEFDCDEQPEEELTQEEFDGSGYSSDKEENRKNRMRENKEFIDYAPISKAECDALLYAEEPDKYEWLNSSLYGGALKEYKRQCA